MASAPKWLQAKIKIPKGLSKSQRREIANQIIDTIIERAESGYGVQWSGDGYEKKKFPKYSKAYINSLDFKNAGKSASEVNLKLTGDMLADLDYIDEKDTKDSITVGYRADYKDRGKVEGNATGERPSGSTKPRPFVGVTDSELNRILSSFDEAADGE